jgi:hypothetical protein
LSIGNCWGQCIKATNGKAAVIFWKDEMLFKLDDDEQEDHWLAFTKKAIDFVNTL